LHTRVALLHRRHDDAIATIGNARCTGKRTPIPRINGAISTAAVIVAGVAVIASFASFDGPIAALDRRTFAKTPRRANASLTFDFAVARATVTFVGVAVVTHLVECRADYTVATTGGCFAG
jgi:hypothetical protein